MRLTRAAMLAAAGASVSTRKCAVRAMSVAALRGAGVTKLDVSRIVAAMRQPPPATDDVKLFLQAAEKRDERIRQAAEKRDERSWRHQLISTLVGAVCALLGGVVAEWLKRRYDDDAANKKLRAALLVDLERVRAVLQDARTAYLQRARHGQAARLLAEASALVDRANEALDRDHDRGMTLLGELGYTADVFNHLRAQIAYHQAALELQASRSLASVVAAEAKLHEAQAKRSGVANASACDNERARVAVKLGDVYSQQRLVDAAMAQYQRTQAAPPQTVPQLETFWHIRARNNRAVAEFGLGQDAKALASMSTVVAATDAWMTSSAAVLEAAPQAADIALRFLAGDKTFSVAELAQFAPVVNLGASDVVDVLHLPFVQSIATPTPQHLEARQVIDPRFRAFTTEFLERVKLTLRKWFTARANVVLFACAPFSSALRDPAGLDAGMLLDHVVQLVSEPAHGGALYMALDEAWIRSEGASRMCAAAGWGLTELVASGAITDSAQAAAATKWANTFTSLARKRVDAACAPHPDVHLCIASLARARFVHMLGDGNPTTRAQTAISVLELPIAGPRGGASVLQWALRQQLSARKIRLEQVDAGLMHTTAGLPPREARWQLGALAVSFCLKEELGRVASEDHRDALVFAAEPWGPRQPDRLSRFIDAASATPRWFGSRSPSAMPVDRCSAPADVAKVQQLLDMLPSWAARWSTTASAGSV